MAYCKFGRLRGSTARRGAGQKWQATRYVSHSALAIYADLAICFAFTQVPFVLPTNAMTQLVGEQRKTHTERGMITVLTLTEKIFMIRGAIKMTVF